jgi:type III secretion protein J
VRLPMSGIRAAVLVGCLLLSACKVELYSKLEERDANEMVALLLQHGIPASRTVANDNTFAVTIDEASFADAVEILKENGYPRQNFASMNDIFPGDKLILSPVEEHARLIYGLSQELSRTISQIDGVVSARVHLVLPVSDPLRQTSSPSSASVFIRYLAGAPLDKLVPQIKMLVADSTEGLRYDNVSVVLVPVDAQKVDSAASADMLTDVAGIWVHKASELRAQILIYASLGISLVSSLAAGYLLLRQGRGRKGLPATTLARSAP